MFSPVRHNQVSRPDVVPAHPTPIIQGLQASWSWNLGSWVTLLVLSCSQPTLRQRVTQTFCPSFCILHPRLLLESTIYFRHFNISWLYFFPEIFFYIPVYFPEGLGCHDLKSIWSDLHPCSSRIRPTSSLCALPTERTAVSSTPSAPCLDSDGEKTRFYPLSGSTFPPKKRCTYELYPPQRLVQIDFLSASPALV